MRGNVHAGSFPEWDFAVQVFDQTLADSLPYDVLDPTKLIPEEIAPLRVIGRMVLDRNPANHFAENDQAAFLPSNIVPGIDFSDDPLLQGRCFPILIPKSPGWGRHTSIRSRSTRRNAALQICSVTA